MFAQLNNKPVLDTDSSEWLLDAFQWALTHFDADFFYNDTVLVLPTNQFFPGRAESAHEMAGLILGKVKEYAGISHWPTQLTDQNTCSLTTDTLIIPYNPQQVSNPEGMIASFAHILSHTMAQTAKEPPPGGVSYWPHVTELLAIYLGFGVMFANSAFTFRGGCGSCYNPNANRNAYLSEREATYALAIFSTLKGLPDSSVTPHLKKHLRAIFKRATKELKRNSLALDNMKGVKSVSASRSSPLLAAAGS